MTTHQAPSGNPLNPSGLPQHITQTDLETKIKSGAQRNIFIGLGLIVASIIITAVSYKLSSSGEYFVFWGIAVWGSVVFARGIYTFVNPYSAIASAHQHSSGLTNQKSKGIMAVIGGLLAIYIAGIAVTTALVPGINGKYTKSDYTASATKACLDAGGNDSYCGCAVDYLVDNTSLDRLKEMDKESDSASSPTPPEITAAAEACIKYFPGASGSPDTAAPVDESI